MSFEESVHPGHRHQGAPVYAPTASPAMDLNWPTTRAAQRAWLTQLHEASPETAQRMVTQMLPTLHFASDVDLTGNGQFLAQVVHVHPTCLETVVAWCEGQLVPPQRHSILPLVVALLCRLDRPLRQQHFARLGVLWALLFSSFQDVALPAESPTPLAQTAQTARDQHLLLALVCEYRTLLSPVWLLSFALHDGFFYLENLSKRLFPADAMHRPALVLDIVLEILRRARCASGFAETVRLSGLLERVASLWRMLVPLADRALAHDSRNVEQLVQALALVSSVSARAVSPFDSPSGLFSAMLPAIMRVGSASRIGGWMLRLATSELRKTLPQSYVLSSSRVMLQSLGSVVVQILVAGLDAVHETEGGPMASASVDTAREPSPAGHTPVNDSQRISRTQRALLGLIRASFQRWDSLACPIGDEEALQLALSSLLDRLYAFSLTRSSHSSVHWEGELLRILAATFPPPLLSPLLPSLFRNALRLAAGSGCESTLATWSAHLTTDGATARLFPALFLRHPGLVNDMHSIIARDESVAMSSPLAGHSPDPDTLRTRALVWLETLVSSPKTLPVLLRFVLDPRQICRLADDCWGRIVFCMIQTSGSFGVINTWTSGDLCVTTLDRLKRRRIADFWQLAVIERGLAETLFLLDDPEDWLFAVETAVAAETVTGIAASFTPDSLLCLLLREMDAHPEWHRVLLHSLSRIVAHIHQHQRRDEQTILAERLLTALAIEPCHRDHLLACLFAERGGLQERADAAVRLDLLILSRMLVWNGSGDGESQHTDDCATRDFGAQVEELFRSITDNAPHRELLHDWDDPVAMLMEYWKFGHHQAAAAIQQQLLVSHLTANQLPELLAVIPVGVLLEMGTFGQRVLRAFIETGLTIAGVERLHELIDAGHMSSTQLVRLNMCYQGHLMLYDGPADMRTGMGTQSSTMADGQ